MSAPTYFVGLDLDLTRNTLIASIGTKPWKKVAGPETFPDSVAGFQHLVAWLANHRCTKKQAVLCMPASGFIGEPLAYFLTARGYSIAIESPLKVKRAFASNGENGHLPDSEQIAEYACRHSAHLQVWQPSPEMLNKIRSLLAERGEPAPARTTAARVKAKRSGPGARAKNDRLHAVDQEIRHLLAPPATIADEWPCF